MEELISQIAACLQRSRRILFVTGAGMSADSGLPTYRGIGGLYDRKLTDDDVPIEVALSGQMLALRPEVTWKYLLQVEQACRGARCNAGHRVLAQVEALRPETWVLTQNIDGFHHEAGSRQVIEIHGRLRHLRCTRCPWHDEVADFSGLQMPPRCPKCRGSVRPKVVLFGEDLPRAQVETLQRELETGFDLVFSIGTSSVFSYITEPVWLAVRDGVPTVEINPGQTNISDAVRWRVRLPAAAALTRIWDAAGLDAGVWR